MFYYLRINLFLTALIALVLLSGTRAATAQKRKDTRRQQIEKVEAERAAARKNGNKNVLDKLVADDFTETNRNGRVLSKSDMLAEQAVQNLRVDDTQIRIYDDTAIVTGRASYISREGAAVATRFTRVWVRRKGNWQLVSHHGSTINSP